MNKQFLLILSFILSFLFISQINAQKKRKKYISNSERFSAGLVLGFNNAQIDGDFFTGFDKLGITGGIRGIARITPRLDFNIEMLFSKKGSKIFQTRRNNSAGQKKNRIIDLTYIDAPFFFKYLLKDKKNVWHIEAGFIYSQLIESKVTENVSDANKEFVYKEIVDDFDKDDISYLFGFGYSLKMGIALNFRYAIGAKKFYQNENYTTPIVALTNSKSVEFLRNYYYSINLSYTLFK